MTPLDISIFICIIVLIIPLIILSVVYSRPDLIPPFISKTSITVGWCIALYFNLIMLFFIDVLFRVPKGERKSRFQFWTSKGQFGWVCLSFLILFASFSSFNIFLPWIRDPLLPFFGIDLYLLNMIFVIIIILFSSVLSISFYFYYQKNKDKW